MQELDKKIDILRSAGYKYSFDREMYVNREKKKAFSVEYVEDTPADQLEQELRENAASADWQFFFVGHISEAVKRELASELG